MLKLLLYNYQQTARYYTIYRTFKQWSSDDFTTILRLFVGRNYDYWLRLFQNLLRLFQPERYDYCLPLLAIGRKPEKRRGGKPPVVPRRPCQEENIIPDVCRANASLIRRQGFSQAWEVSRPPPDRPCAGGDADPSAGASGAELASDPQTVGADPAGLAWSAICYVLIYLIIIGRLC